jgi:hypothetical protein
MFSVTVDTILADTFHKIAQQNTVVPTRMHGGYAETIQHLCESVFVMTRNPTKRWNWIESMFEFLDMSSACCAVKHLTWRSHEDGHSWMFG